MAKILEGGDKLTESAIKDWKAAIKETEIKIKRAGSPTESAKSFNEIKAKRDKKESDVATATMPEPNRTWCNSRSRNSNITATEAQSNASCRYKICNGSKDGSKDCK